MTRLGSIIYLTDNKKNKCEYNIILTFDTEKNNHYMIYTDNEVDEDGFIKTYVGKLSDTELLPVKDENILKMAEALLKKIDN